MDRRDCCAEVASVDRLARAFADEDFAAVERDLDLFLRRARRAGVKPLLLGLVADRGERTIVRQRAFGRAACEFVRLEPASKHRRSRADSRYALADDACLPPTGTGS